MIKNNSLLKDMIIVRFQNDFKDNRCTTLEQHIH